MSPLLTYYSPNEIPNDEELKACCDIAAKFKDNVMLMYGDINISFLSHVQCLFIQPGDSLDSVKYRLSKSNDLPFSVSDVNNFSES